MSQDKALKFLADFGSGRRSAFVAIVFALGLTQSACAVHDVADKDGSAARAILDSLRLPPGS